MNHDLPTPYPEVNAVLDELCTRARAVLGNQFVGLALYGSLASGDFDPESSDIDFVVITGGELPAAVVLSLAETHAGLADDAMPWSAKLEGAYVPGRDLRRHDPAAPPCPYVNEGRFHVVRLGSDWVIQRHVLRQHGVTVAGPDIRGLIDPVGPDELRRAVADALGSWWAPMLERLDPRLRLEDGLYQAYAVLTMCRALHTLRHGTIVSKPVAGRWARANLDPARAALIDWALAWPAGGGGDHLSETLAFIHYTVEQGRQFTGHSGPHPGPV